MTVSLCTAHLLWLCSVTTLNSGTSASLTGGSSKQVAVFLLPLSRSKCSQRGCPAASPSLAICLLVACVLVQFFSFPSNNNQLLPVFLKVSQQKDLIFMQVIQRTWQGIYGQASCLAGILIFFNSVCSVLPHVYWKAQAGSFRSSCGLLLSLVT